MAHTSTLLVILKPPLDIENVNEIMNNIARWSENEGWEALGTDTFRWSGQPK